MLRNCLLLYVHVEQCGISMLQSIFGFRGASAEKWQENFKLYGDKGETVLLNNNYRSRKAIVVAGNILREIRSALRLLAIIVGKAYDDFGNL